MNTTMLKYGPVEFDNGLALVVIAFTQGMKTVSVTCSVIAIMLAARVFIFRKKVTVQQA